MAYFRKDKVKLVSRKSPHGEVIKWDLREGNLQKVFEHANKTILKTGDDVGALFYDFSDEAGLFSNEGVDAIRSILSAESLNDQAKYFKKKEEQPKKLQPLFKEAFKDELDRLAGVKISNDSSDMGGSEVKKAKLDKDKALVAKTEAQKLAQEMFGRHQPFAFFEKMKQCKYFHQSMTNSKKTESIDGISHVVTEGKAKAGVDNFVETNQQQLQALKTLGYDFSTCQTHLEKIELALKVIKDGKLEKINYYLREQGFFPDDNTGLAMNGLNSIMDKLISGAVMEGISTPYDYVGLIMSIFALHIEDLIATNSCNMLWFGDPKVWFIIPPSEFNVLNEKYLRHMKEHECEQKPCNVQHKIAFIDPKLLDEWGIKYTVYLQEPGTMIVTKALAYHQGINLGLNWARALNLTLKDYANAVITIDPKYFCWELSCGKDAKGKSFRITPTLDLLILLWYSVLKEKYFLSVYPFNSEWKKSFAVCELISHFKRDIEEIGGVENFVKVLEKARGLIEGEDLKVTVENLLQLGTKISSNNPLTSLCNETEMTQDLVQHESTSSAVVVIQELIQPEDGVAVEDSFQNGIEENNNEMIDVENNENESNSDDQPQPFTAQDNSSEISNSNRWLRLVNEFQKDEYSADYVSMDEILKSKAGCEDETVRKMLQKMANLKQRENPCFRDTHLNQLANLAMKYGMSFKVFKGEVTTEHGFEINPVTNMPFLKCLCSRGQYGANKSNGRVLHAHLESTLKKKSLK